MATVTRTHLVDDLDGTEGGVETVRFSIDKQEYEIDLAPEKRWVSAGSCDGDGLPS